MNLNISRDEQLIKRVNNCSFIRLLIVWCQFSLFFICSGDLLLWSGSWFVVAWSDFVHIETFQFQEKLTSLNSDRKIIILHPFKTKLQKKNTKLLLLFVLYPIIKMKMSLSTVQKKNSFPRTCTKNNSLFVQNPTFNSTKFSPKKKKGFTNFLSIFISSFYYKTIVKNSFLLLLEQNSLFFNLPTFSHLQMRIFVGNKTEQQSNCIYKLVEQTEFNYIKHSFNWSRKTREQFGANKIGSFIL